ncbi:MAG TPA: nucleoside triphosphate pyrophosphohydrolase [Acidimicrobiia bacterium]
MGVAPPDPDKPQSDREDGVAANHGMITIIGLGPGSLDRVPKPVRSLLLDPDRVVVARTRHHPAAEELAREREVLFCDDLYEQTDRFDDVYEAITQRVIEHAGEGSVIYAVPGSPLIGEFAVRKILEATADVELIPGESFVDAVLAAVGYDPLDRGLQILNGHELPDPLILDKPTLIGHLDTPEVLADVLDGVARVLAEDAQVTLLAGLGADDAKIVTDTPDAVESALAGFRTSMFIDAEPGGLAGAIRVMRRLRSECPWDQEQTHQTLVKNLVEESYELIEAIGRLPRDDIDWVAYAAVEDELGDVLLQVLFHEAIARENEAFDIDGVAEVMRQKLVRRHPHVFGDVAVSGAEEVKQNWDRIKQAESQESARSVLDGVPTGLPALQRSTKIQNRAAKVGFDWERADQVLVKVREELDELERALDGHGDVEAELGDVIFSIVNLSRHLGTDPELALSRATDVFESRFRVMEEEGTLEGLDLDELNQRWERAKQVSPEA